MSDRDLRAGPYIVNQHFWWYEVKRGICICTEAFTHEGTRHVEINYIPWNSIRAALKRKDKK